MPIRFGCTPGTYRQGSVMGQASAGPAAQQEVGEEERQAGEFICERFGAIDDYLNVCGRVHELCFVHGFFIQFVYVMGDADANGTQHCVGEYTSKVTGNDCESATCSRTCAI